MLSFPDPEVRPKAKHRRFTAEYKKRILDETDACTRPGEVGALLRREGLYSSLLSKWRQQRAQGTLTALAPQRRGPKPDPQADEIARLRRENERLQERLKQAETIIEVQKKSRSYSAYQPTRSRQTSRPNHAGERYGAGCRDQHGL